MEELCKIDEESVVLGAQADSELGLQRHWYWANEL